MKFATVRYNGTIRRKTHRAPSGTHYTFGHGVEVDDLGDARFFEEKPNYEVTWTATGTLAERFADGYDEAKQALKDLGYRTKQDLAKVAGVKANQSEDELEEELEEFAEQLKHQMEHQ